MGIFSWFKRKEPSTATAAPVPGKKMPPQELKRMIIGLTGKSHGVSVLEAGASGGEDTLGFASLPEVEHVYAFEPVEKSFQLLQGKVAGNPKIRIFQQALADVPGVTTMHVSSNVQRPGALPSSSTLLQPSGHLDFHTHIKFDDTQQVAVTTVDQWAAEHSIPRIDVMWLDVQGAEHLLLTGAKRMLSGTSVIFSEVSLKPMYANSLLYPEYRKFLAERGFVVHSEYLFWEDMGNVLFVRK